MTTSLLDSAAIVRACVFTLGGETFAVDVRQVREVMVTEEYSAVPLAPPHVIGVANLHGDIVPIVDAGSLLGLSARRGERRLRTVVVSADGLEAAVVIDGVMSLEAFTEVVAAPGARQAAWAYGYVRRDDRLVPLLDMVKVLRALRPTAGRSGRVA